MKTDKMKSLTESINGSINEARSDWKLSNSGTIAKGVDILNVDVRLNKSYGFVSYDNDSNTVSLIAADSMEEMAEALSIDTEMIEKLWDLRVGDARSDILDNSTTMRIW